MVIQKALKRESLTRLCWLYEEGKGEGEGEVLSCGFGCRGAAVQGSQGWAGGAGRALLGGKGVPARILSLLWLLDSRCKTVKSCLKTKPCFISAKPCPWCTHLSMLVFSFSLCRLYFKQTKLNTDLKVKDTWTFLWWLPSDTLWTSLFLCSWEKDGWAKVSSNMFRWLISPRVMMYWGTSGRVVHQYYTTR